MGRLFATFYDRVTRRTEAACLQHWRREVLAHARGVVVELGAGTGWSLGCYPEQGIERLILTEPDRHMRSRLERRVAASGREHQGIEVVDARGDALPCADGSVDTAVAGLVLCTVPDLHGTLAEVMRVLRPGGQLLFMEHVAAEHGSRLRRWQHRLEPVWRMCAEGCRLTRDTAGAIAGAGFEVEELTADRMRPAPAWVQPAIRGRARKPL
jgi:ubiquinone/menaquinone biosynthesis C-methylase UbiE